jgi:hypothetical protein
VVDDPGSPTRSTATSAAAHFYLAYDDQNLYFAFHCLDSSPEQIKTSLCKRDGIFEDDWVGCRWRRGRQEVWL